MPDAWVFEGLESGVGIYRLEAWSSFYSLVEQFVAEDRGVRPRDFIWRGQRDPGWPLSPSLDRVLARLFNPNPHEVDSTSEARVQRHLERFKFAVRGRRGVNPPELKLENDW